MPYYSVLRNKVIYNHITLDLPRYLTFYNGNSRLRSTHLDSLSLVSNLCLIGSNLNILNKSFFCRSHTIWNSLPFHIRTKSALSEFKTKLVDYLQNEVYSEDSNIDCDWYFASCNDKMTYQYPNAMLLILMQATFRSYKVYS